MVSVGARLQQFAGFCKVFHLLIDTLLYIMYRISLFLQAMTALWVSRGIALPFLGPRH